LLDENIGLLSWLFGIILKGDISRPYYYTDASRNPKYKNKITNQRFNSEHIIEEIQKILSYQSDALHWNLLQTEDVGKIAQKALDSYSNISNKLNVEMHSFESAIKRINKLMKGRDEFIKLSRGLAKKAQERESVTIQPKENLVGEKGKLTIKNYLGGHYYFTCDEVVISGENIFLIEGKHTKTGNLPSLGDIKDGLLKMILWVNLENVRVGKESYNPIPVLKLTTGKSTGELSKPQEEVLNLLKKEAIVNEFKVKINNEVIV
jgi:hypothetical protein